LAFETSQMKKAITKLSRFAVNKSLQRRRDDTDKDFQYFFRIDVFHGRPLEADDLRQGLSVAKAALSASVSYARILHFHDARPPGGTNLLMNAG